MTRGAPPPAGLFNRRLRRDAGRKPPPATGMVLPHPLGATAAERLAVDLRRAAARRSADTEGRTP